jgi:hypothetical protein
VRGVDNLSTDDIRSYATSLFPSFEFQIEWIDDTSLNLAYESSDIATSALQALSSPHIEELPSTTLRPAKHLTTEKSIDGLKIRIAFMGDKKERGARDRSRWYLFNPHPSEQYERRYLNFNCFLILDGIRDVVVIDGTTHILVVSVLAQNHPL